MPCVLGTAWLGPTLETFKARATSAGGDTGTSPQLGLPGGATVQSLLRCHGRLWHGADPGPVPVLSPLDELRKLFGPSREAPGCRDGHWHWPGSLPSPSQLGGRSQPPSPALSAFQDRTTGSPAHPLSSAPSTMSEVTGPRSPRGGAEDFSTGRTRLSQCQTGAGSRSRVPLS